MLFPKEYKACLKRIKQGKYGEEWQRLALSEEYIAVDASNYLYLCGACGYWEVSPSLSLYRPKAPETIPDQQFGIKTVREWGEVPYVMPHDLENDYIFLKSYVHHCGRCGRRMHKADPVGTFALPCPKCGTENAPGWGLKWD